MLLVKFYCRASNFLKYSIALGELGQNGEITPKCFSVEVHVKVMIASREFKRCSSGFLHLGFNTLKSFCVVFFRFELLGGEK
jgi:hypothetical protein